MGDWDDSSRKGKAPVKYNKTGLATKRCSSNGVYNWLASKYWPGAGKHTAKSRIEDRIISRYGKEVLNSD